MLTENLIELVEKIRHQKTEEQQVELKAAHMGCPTRLYDTLSSFSNQDSGGVIVFGIDEKLDYEIVGVYNLQDLQQKVTEQCNQMEPPIRAVFTIATIDGKPICSAEIPSLDISERPCYYRGAGRVKGSYIRVGDADLPMTDYELYSFEAFRKRLNDDIRPVDRAELSLLDQTQMDAYIIKRKAARPGFAQLTREQTLEMLGITANGIPTLASIMSFGIYPQGYFPQLGITAIVVPGTQIGDLAPDSARFLNNKRIEGTIPNMIQESLAFCSLNMKVKTTIDSKTGIRTDRTEYPIDALREAILNALIHRDYSIHTEGMPVQIDFFTDRVEIHSPGSLYGRMSVEQLGFARADVRNPTLAIMTETLTEAENRNSGIPTMRRSMQEYGLPAPKFENRRQEFVVTFFNTPLEPNSTKKTQRVKQSDIGDLLLDFCRIPRSRKEIADFLDIKTITYAMQHYIYPLIADQKLALTIPEAPKSNKQKYYSVNKI